MSIIKQKVDNKLNEWAKRSYWYNHTVFGDCSKFWGHRTFDMDVVNLGSSSALAAFDYSEYPKLKAANWAMAPQSFVADYEILKNYSCYLRPGATVIIPICPFSCLGGSNNDLPDKYYTVLNIASMPHASFRRQQEQQRIRQHPWSYIPFVQLLSINHKKKDMEIAFFQNDATNRMEGWKKEFSIMSFDYPLSILNKDAYEDGVILLSDMINYCKERGYKPVLVLPPVHKTLSSCFTPQMKTKCVDSFVGKVLPEDVFFLDYFTDDRFTDAMFSNSFLLNSKGASLFTKICLTDIKIV